jgi:hypothetical protein
MRSPFLVHVLRLVRRVCGKLRGLWQVGLAEGVGGWLDRLTLGDAPVLAGLRAKLAAFVHARGPVWFKIRISTALLVAACLAMVFSPGGGVGTPSAWVALGMGFSWVGDALLMRYPPARRAVRQYFLWSIAFFAAAQCCYIRMLYGLYAGAGDGTHWPMWLAVLIYAGTAMVAMCAFILPNEHQPLVLRLAAIPYALLVSWMAGSAVAVCVVTVGRGALLMAGGLLFYLSDALVTQARLGSVRLRYADFWIWVTYAPAQLFLILGAAHM